MPCSPCSPLSKLKERNTWTTTNSILLVSVDICWYLLVSPIVNYTSRLFTNFLNLCSRRTYIARNCTEFFLRRNILRMLARYCHHLSVLNSLCVLSDLPPHFLMILFFSDICDLSHSWICLVVTAFLPDVLVSTMVVPTLSLPFS